MDLESSISLSKLKIPYKFVDDLFNPRERFEIYKRARLYENEMCENFYQDETSNFKVSFDRVVFNCYWYEFVLQEFLYERFIKDSVQEIQFFKFNNYGPAVHESFSDTFGNFWIHKKSNILVKPINIFNKNHFLHKILLSIRNLSYFLQNKITHFMFQKEMLTDPILFSCTLEEFYYYKENILDIKKSIAPSEIIILINNINFLDAVKMKKKYGIKFFSYLPNFFRNRMSLLKRKNDTHNDRNAYFAMQADSKNFNYFEKVRWPSLRSHRKNLLALVNVINPRIVIYTSIEDYCNQMIGDVANELNIESISLSHGVLGSTRRGVSFASKFAVGNKLAKFCANQSGIKSEKINIFRKLDPSHEYPMDHIISVNSKKFNILVLTDPIKASSETRVFSSPVVGYRDQIKSLNDVSYLLNENQMNLIIKTHPGWPEKELIELADKNLISCVCPSDTSLENLLDKVDLVIALNYAGAALIPAIKRELPIILHYVAPYKVFSELESTYSRFMNLNLGIVTENANELLAACKSASNDKNFLKTLRASSRVFKENFLLTNDYLTLSEFISSNFK